VCVHVCVTAALCTHMPPAQHPHSSHRCVHVLSCATSGAAWIWLRAAQSQPPCAANEITDGHALAAALVPRALAACATALNGQAASRAAPVPGTAAAGGAARSDAGGAGNSTAQAAPLECTSVGLPPLQQAAHLGCAPDMVQATPQLHAHATLHGDLELVAAAVALLGRVRAQGHVRAEGHMRAQGQAWDTLDHSLWSAAMAAAAALEGGRQSPHVLLWAGLAAACVQGGAPALAALHHAARGQAAAHGQAAALWRAEPDVGPSMELSVARQVQPWAGGTVAKPAADCTAADQGAVELLSLLSTAPVEEATVQEHVQRLLRLAVGQLVGEAGLLGAEQAEQLRTRVARKVGACVERERAIRAVPTRCLAAAMLPCALPTLT